MVKRWNETRSLEILVCALCLDFRRRAEAIKNKSVSRRTETEFKYYNYKMLDAAAEVVGERFAEIYIYEIGNNVGYAKTAVDCVSEVTYKQYKQRIRENIIRELHLA